MIIEGRLFLFGTCLLAPWASVFAEPVELVPLLVYGERLDEKSNWTPGSSTVISQEVLDQAPLGSLANLLESQAGLPSLSFFGDPGLGSPVLRGFGENASSRTLILLDGLPVDTPDLAASPWFQFPVSGLSQVEVLRGSRTVRYGSGALGGVISLESRTSRGEVEGSVEAVFGSFESETYRGNLSLPLGDWGVGIHVDRNLSEGYRENSGIDSTAWSAVLQSPESDSFEARWFLSGNSLTFENPGSLSRAQFEEDPRQSINERFGLGDQFVNENESLRVAQKLTWFGKGEDEITFNTSWLNRERENNFGPGSHSDQDLETLFAEGVYRKGGDVFSWEVGVRGTYDSLRSTRYLDFARESELGVADLDRWSVGAFGLARVELSDSLALTGGVGWDHWSLDAAVEDFRFPNDTDLNFSTDRSGQGVSAELALEYGVNEDWNLWLRYDRVYRFPVIDEIAAFQGFLLAEPFNADLEAETGHAVEFGWEFERGAWNYEGSLFSQWLEGEIGFDFVENLNVNFADTHRIGLENRLSWERDSWAFSLNHSLTFARYRSGSFNGNEVPLVPLSILAGRVSWKPVEKLTLGLETLAVSSSPEGNDFENDQDRLEGRWLFNSEVAWELREGVQLRLRADNLFDEDYAVLQFQGQFYPGNARRVSLGLKIDF